MPRGKQLTEIEQGQVKAYRECGMTIRAIAERIHKSRNVVLNCIHLGENYGKKKRSGRKPTLSARDIREVKRLATNSSNSPAQIKGILGLSVGKRRIQQILHNDDNCVYTKRAPYPRLMPRHKTARLAFAEKYQFWEEEWQSVVFSDEKKFNLDGPDGCQYHWQDKRKPKQKRMARNFGGGSLMVWGGFGYNGKTPICVVSTKMNSEKYVELLDGVLLNCGHEIGGPEWIFQQDNAAIHASRYTKNFLNTNNIPILDWPACSPDLNPIENLWGMLVDKVYASGRQYETVRTLKAAVQDAWSSLEPEQLKRLINSMPRRLQQVIINRGGSTEY